MKAMQGSRISSNSSLCWAGLANDKELGAEFSGLGLATLSKAADSWAGVRASDELMLGGGAGGGAWLCWGDGLGAVGAMAWSSSWGATTWF